MGTRYVAKSQFAVYIDGTPRVFKPDYIDPTDGLQGYATLPAGLSKAQKASFDVIETGGVEQATAAPGEKRTRKKPAAQAVEVEPAEDDDEA